ncbi:hypothetical protein C8A00DRAFT_29366 [Chaetomidium leptoderma]|uniref:Uncharacterized protein n=1 Tax=Chaetomidium leptoderma TaxID=669021 RepID=A0AAN6VTX5_9PEZI|nr:hypothetical protein C8A00DRAFT_29366 [Chaetomidium leptoderma]
MADTQRPAKVTILFFLWGFAYGLLDEKQSVLNSHFQSQLQISASMAAGLSLAYFGAYFICPPTISVAGGLLTLPAFKPRYMLTGYLGLCVVFLVAAMNTFGTTSIVMLTLVLCFESCCFANIFTLELPTPSIDKVLQLEAQAREMENKRDEAAPEIQGDSKVGKVSQGMTC